MAGWNFRRGLCLLQFKKQLDLASRRTFVTSLRVLSGHAPSHGGDVRPLPIKCDIGNREVVGYGMNGEESYLDDPHAPFPAIRFREDTGDILKLREKEKGDWKRMTLEEKRTLYRASFCQTIAENTASNGDWKLVIGLTFAAIGAAFWGFMWLKLYVYDPLPRTFEDDWLKGSVERMIAQGSGPIQGFASKYDYEKGQFKK